MPPSEGIPLPTSPLALNMSEGIFQKAARALALHGLTLGHP
jgi:hypothetical protein